MFQRPHPFLLPLTFEKKIYTLQEINISHLGEKENHLQNAIFGGYVSSLGGYIYPSFESSCFMMKHLGEAWGRSGTHSFPAKGPAEYARTVRSNSSVENGGLDYLFKS